VASVLARLPLGIHALALVLFLRERTGSYGTAGILTAVFALGAGAGAPLAGRLIDHIGQRRVLPPMAIAHAVTLVGLVMLVLRDVPPAALAPVAFLAGLCLPPMSSVMRSLWPVLLGGDAALLTAAFALESVIIELVFVAGPLFVALIVAVASPELALLIAAGLAVIGTLWFVAQPPSRAHVPSEHAGSHGALGALRSRQLRLLLVTIVPVGFCLGAAEVTLPAFAEDAGDRALAGVLIAVWSVASAVGGLWYGAHEHPLPLGQRFTRLSVLLPLTYLPLAFAPSVPLMLVLLIPAGLCLAPLLTAGNQLAGLLAPRGTETEAYTWPITALIVGVAFGNTVAGVLIEGPGWRMAFVAAAAGGSLGAVLAVARRRELAASARA
jgi:MFS family permease